MIQIGTEIKQHRKMANITQFKLAALSGVTSNYICQIELGKAKNIGIQTLERISDVLGAELVIHIKKKRTKSQ